MCSDWCCITYTFTARALSPSTALAAAALVGFMPDVLAHGGVAYNDVPLALAFFAAVWALDVAVRRPSVRSGVIAGALSALAVGIKFSAGALLPVGLVLLVVEVIADNRDRQWWNRIVGAAGRCSGCWIPGASCCLSLRSCIVRVAIRPRVYRAARDARARCADVPARQDEHERVLVVLSRRLLHQDAGSRCTFSSRSPLRARSSASTRRGVS